LLLLGDDLLDALQKGDRDRAAHAATVERKHALRTRAEEVPVARVVLRGGRLFGILSHIVHGGGPIMPGNVAWGRAGS
jgi:hypothetical protein